MSSDYKVKINIFEGPLDLLLHLIKVNELEISEISISTITGQYLDYLRLMETLDLEVAGDFLVMAATLLNIKLRSLLPDPQDGEDEEEEAIDQFLSARTLMQQLVEYRKFKEMAVDLGRKAQAQDLTFMRDVALPKLVEADVDPAIQGDLEQLLDAFSRVIRFVSRRDYHQVQEEEYTVEDKVDHVRRLFLVEPRLLLSQLFEKCRDKIEMIVTLLALLEMCRLKELGIQQSDGFGEVFVYHKQTEATDNSGTDEPQPETSPETTPENLIETPIAPTDNETAAEAAEVIELSPTTDDPEVLDPKDSTSNKSS